MQDGAGNVLVLSSPESLNSGGTVVVTGADGQKNLANVHTRNGTVGLTPSTTHTGLKTIRTSARQHLVDTDDVVRVGTMRQLSATCPPCLAGA